MKKLLILFFIFPVFCKAQLCSFIVRGDTLIHINPSTGAEERVIVGSNNLKELTNAGTARTNLGATTIGANVFTAANPGAVRYFKANADNTFSFRTAAEMLSDIIAVQSVATAAGTTTLTSSSVYQTVFTGSTTQDFTNSAKLWGTLGAQNDLPSSQAMSGITGSTASYWGIIY